MPTPDQILMREALRLAAKGRGQTSPNPMVGAVIANGGRIIGRGYHHRAGGPHAEVIALKQAGGRAQGSTLYVNLEPCCHQGRTPPCTEAIIPAGVGRVVTAIIDPNPLVNGKGIRKLRRAGIQVEVGLLEEKAKRLNESYLKFITTGKPFVTLKLALSLDGKIATQTGGSRSVESRWISGQEARAYVHRLRQQCDAVMVGIGTVLADDPELTARSPSGKKKVPVRIVVDSRGRLPLKARILNPPDGTIVATTHQATKAKVENLEKTGATVLILPEQAGKVNLSALMTELGKRQITNLLIEGGGELAAGALEAGIVDKIVFIIAPKIIGGQKAPTAVEGKGISRLTDAWQLREVRVGRLGQDIKVEGYL